MEHIQPDNFRRCSAAIHNRFHSWRPEELCDCRACSLPSADGCVQRTQPPAVRLCQYHCWQLFLWNARFIGDSVADQLATASAAFRKTDLLAGFYCWTLTTGRPLPFGVACVFWSVNTACRSMVETSVVADGFALSYTCLLYTSDAADEEDSVDL